MFGRKKNKRVWLEVFTYEKDGKTLINIDHHADNWDVLAEVIAFIESNIPHYVKLFKDEGYGEVYKTRLKGYKKGSGK